jgi:hypothetical protein
MGALQSAFTLLGNYGRTLLAQISVGLSVPLETESADRPEARGLTKRLDLCDEIPGSLCSNGYGSLEVGGLRDRVDD